MTSVVRVPLFHERAGFRPPHRGPLLGRRILVVVAPTECDARGVQALHHALHPLGVYVGVTSECHGEARGEDGRALHPDGLLLAIEPSDWQALVFAGGQGAASVAEDQLARALAKRFAAAGKMVAALGAGERVLASAHLDGLRAADPRVLARAIADRLAGAS